MLNGKASVLFGGNAGGYLRAIAAPTSALAQSSIFSASAYFFSFVGQFAAQANGGNVYTAPNAGPFSSEAGYGATLRQAGGTLVQTIYEGSYEETAVTQAASVPVLVQGRFRAGTVKLLELRVGKGALVLEPTDSTAVLSDAFLLASSQGLLGDWTGHIQELITGQYAATDAELNDLADRAASLWGVTL